jgi:bacillithiol biosynthesis deacetylase BshB1
MSKKILKILIFAAHPDDAELGMGGTIKHMADDGHDVMVIDLTDGEPTPCGSRAKRKKESLSAAAVLGVTRQTLGYKNRELLFDIEKRDHIAGIIREFCPDVIFSHYQEDSHPDHVETGKIVNDAIFAARLTKSDITGKPFRVKRLYYYYALHLKKIVVPDFFIKLTELDFESKIKALKCYKSQFIDNKQNNYVFDYIESRDKYWGYISGGNYAEGFASREALVVKDIADIQ